MVVSAKLFVMPTITITHVPPGHTPLPMREAWVGTTMKYDRRRQRKNKFRIHVVALVAAQALRDLDRHDAANFWEKLGGKGMLGFPPECCKSTR